MNELIEKIEELRQLILWLGVALIVLNLENLRQKDKNS